MRRFGIGVLLQYSLNSFQRSAISFQQIHQVVFHNLCQFGHFYGASVVKMTICEGKMAAMAAAMTVDFGGEYYRLVMCEKCGISGKGFCAEFARCVLGESGETGAQHVAPLPLMVAQEFVLVNYKIV